MEMHGEMHRGITILKMRGTMHNEDIREFKIDGLGMYTVKPFHNVFCYLSGAPVYVNASDQDLLNDLSREET